MAASMVRCLVQRNSYRDSVELMRLAAELERLPGVSSAALLMGTPANRELLGRAGLLHGAATEAGPNDLIVAVAADEEAAIDPALVRAAELLADAGPVGGSGSAGDRPAPATIAAALQELAGANLAIISTPGPYATAEALKALKRGLHVFIFSDNVPLAEEIELKRLAECKGLLVMGPDCGTAILDGVPIGFANAVRRGRIGLIGASGTGLQQVSCLIDRLGQGVSQAIGVGGRDLDEQVGGRMMLGSLARLAADPDTAVIVLLSKPPAAAVAGRVLAAAGACGKPVVVNFLGGDSNAVWAAGAVPAETLEGAAEQAVALAGGMPPSTAALPELPTEISFVPGQRVVRGLYSGGTLAKEAALILAAADPPVEATVVDLGDDEYTVGRPHPMIDYRLRNEQIVAAAAEPSTAVILLDIVLGYGSHPDPADALGPALEQARAAAAGRPLAVVGSVCGTPGDPQGLAGQEAALRQAGVLLAPSNAQAARLAAMLGARASRAMAEGRA